MASIEMSGSLRRQLKDVYTNSLARELNRGITETPKINYLDLRMDGNDIMLSFLDSKRKVPTGDDPYSTKLRQETKFGRGIKKLFPNASDDDVRNLTEAFRSRLVAPKTITMYTCQGVEIYNHYMIPPEKCTNAGNRSLQASCYQGKSHIKYFDVLINNPQTFKLLVAFGNKGLFDGRALYAIGKDANGKPQICFDNIRCNSTEAQQEMYRIAEEMGALFYGPQGYQLGKKVLPNHGYTETGEWYAEIEKPGLGMHHWDRFKYRKNDKRITLNGCPSNGFGWDFQITLEKALEYYERPENKII